ncbi:tetratricopeptide repeat protein [Maribacter sp. Asnod1-A12]|uniref:tetratricopeptide repeat protein n=1 Tax=Maribacter sp. Asnod1-A12 TaxID=3160576 RepID=UPI00386872BB
MNKELLLYQYFANQLSESEQKLFNDLLESDMDFKAQFKFESDLKRVISKNENDNLKKKLVGFENEIKSANPNSKTNVGLWSMAASFALLIALGYLAYTTFAGPNYDSLYASNFETYPNTVYTITRSDNVETIARNAFAAYEANNHEIAVVAFLSLKKQEETAQIDFYLAQSYLNLGKEKEAIETLKNVIDNDIEFKAEAHWYLALAYLKEEDRVNAIATLKNLIEDFDYKKDKAQELLIELN